MELAEVGGVNANLPARFIEGFRAAGVDKRRIPSKSVGDDAGTLRLKAELDARSASGLVDG